MFQTSTRAPVYRVTVDDSVRVSSTPVLLVLVAITVTAVTSDSAGIKIFRNVFLRYWPSLIFKFHKRPSLCIFIFIEYYLALKYRLEFDG